MGEIHGLLLPVARRGQLTARQPGEARERKQTWGPSPCPATPTLPSSRPPGESSKENARANVPQRAGGKWGWKEGGGFGERSCPGKQEGQSLSDPCARGEETDDWSSRLRPAS